MRRSLPQEKLKRPRSGKFSGQVQIEPQKKNKIKRSYPHADEIEAVEEEELILFCKRSGLDNKNQILQAMEKCFQNRRNWIVKTNPTAHEILDRYPRFQDYPAILHQEFKLLFPAASSKLITTWETRFCTGILHISEMSRLPKIQALMNNLYHRDVSDHDDYQPSADEISLFAFLLVVYLLPSHTGKESSISDSISHLMVTKPTGTTVDSFLQKKEQD